MSRTAHRRPIRRASLYDFGGAFDRPMASEEVVTAFQMPDPAPPQGTGSDGLTNEMILAWADDIATEENTGAVALSAYAPTDPGGLDDPFAAILAPPGLIGPDGAKTALPKGEHSWLMNRLPKGAQTAAQRRCLAEGIYFEARGEPTEGQAAVAQVIINRVKNPAYPSTICGVVYQNKRWRNRCQFSFACDGKKERIRDRNAWNTARKVADAAIEGKTWLPEVGSSTHYHANYVSPSWARSMKRKDKIGRHIFYQTKSGGWS